MHRRKWLSLSCLHLALLLAACANPAHLWHRQGIGDAQRDQDYKSCVAETRDTSEAGEAADIEASENNASHMPGVLPETSFNRGAAMTSGNGLGQCMFDKGYAYD